MAIFVNSSEIFGYDKKVMLTYILGTSTLTALVLSSRSIDVAGEISSGELSNFLLKPINYFRYWFTRDLADKAVNIGCAAIEICLVYLALKPQIFLPGNLLQVLFFVVASFLGIFIYFYLSFFISLTTFWYTEHDGWPVRFLFTVLVSFVAGGLFPLDILPEKTFGFIKFLPTTYLLFFPMQVWLGRLSLHLMVEGFILGFVWIAILKFLTKSSWRKGLKIYEAYGR